MVREGDLFKRIFDNYEALKKENANLNFGWELIRKHFTESLLQRICNEKNPIKY